jgi:hypothetical protein
MVFIKSRPPSKLQRHGHHSLDRHFSGQCSSPSPMEILAARGVKINALTPEIVAAQRL